MNYHLVLDKLKDKTIHLMPINIVDQVVDLFTKALDFGYLPAFVTKLGLLNIHSNLRGAVEIQMPNTTKPKV